jgi:hypothetical protein
MSVASTLDIEAYRLLDPRLSQNQSTRAFQTTIGGSNVTYRQEASNSVSSNQVSFQLTPNSPNNVLDRTFMLTTKATVSFATTYNDDPGTTRCLEDGFNACRGFNSIVESTNVAINGLTISQETKYVKDIYSRFADDLDGLVKFKSMSPSLMTEGDNFVNYSSGTDTTINPLGSYMGSTRRANGRGFYPIRVVSNATDATPGNPLLAEVEVDIVELFTISPLEYDGNLVPGLANVTSLQLNFNLSSDKQRFWSFAKRDAGEIAAIDNITFSDYKVHFCEITLPVFYSLPPSIALSYYDVQRQFSGSQLVAGSPSQANKTKAQISTQTYQLNQTPSRIIVVVKPVEQNNVHQSDTYAHITGINIQYNNMSSILSSASTQQLFAISSRNGSTQSYAEWSGYAVDYGNAATLGEINNQVALTGSILCLDFGKDVSADPTSIPGTSINANFSMTINYENNTSVATTYEAVVYYVYSGVMVVSPGSAFSYRSLLTRDESLSLPLLEGDSAGSSNLKGGAATAKQYGLSGFAKAKQALDKASGSGMRAGLSAGMSAAGVHTSGRSSGLTGGMARSKSSLSDIFK